MHNNILPDNKNLFTKFSRREFLLLLISLSGLPVVNSFTPANTPYNDRLKKIINNYGVILLAEVKTGKIIGYSSFTEAFKPYTIGSLAKLITATALLEEELITSKETYFCRGYETHGNKLIRCWNPNGHGLLTVESAIAKSCNLFFRHFSNRISSEDIIKYFRIYNIDKYDTDYKTANKNVMQLKPSNNSYITALGLDKNLILSPIQMLSLSCSIARKGIYRPLYFKIPSIKEYKLPIKDSTLSIVRGGMTGCATEGTAALLHKNGYNTAAKTGTAPNKYKGNHGWCIGFTPVENPVLAFCIMIKHGTGLSDAVPIANKVLDLCKNTGLI